MNQTYQDHCSKCGQECDRVRVRIMWPKSTETFDEAKDRYFASPARYVTACCSAPPIAKPIAMAAERTA